jgi:hypothetical protein
MILVNPNLVFIIPNEKSLQLKQNKRGGKLPTKYVVVGIVKHHHRTLIKQKKAATKMWLLLNQHVYIGVKVSLVPQP